MTSGGSEHQSSTTLTDFLKPETPQFARTTSQSSMLSQLTARANIPRSSCGTFRLGGTSKTKQQKNKWENWSNLAGGISQMEDTCKQMKPQCTTRTRYSRWLSGSVSSWESSTTLSRLGLRLTPLDTQQGLRSYLLTLASISTSSRG
jgi:hypothetical protein